MNGEQQRMLAIMGSGYTSFTGPAPPRAQTLDLQNIPGMSGQLGMILSMALQPLITQMATNMGFAGLQFSGTQSLYDRYYAQDFFLESRKAIQQASRRDEDLYFKQLLGVAKLSNTQIDEDVKRSARTMAGDLAKMGTILGDVAPDFFDQMHGVRGSNATMARRIHLGGRYAFDPITGQLGLTGDTASKLSTGIYDNLFGDQADLTLMKGLGAGRVGQLYDELQRRGFMAGGPSSREDSFARLASRLGTDPTVYAKLLATTKLGMSQTEFDTDPKRAMDLVMSTPEIKEQITKAESDRISNRLKNLVGAVSAMRDIFGDMGKSNAPMAELINGLQMLTQGGLATMQGGDLERVVRTTHLLGRTAGMSMENMMQLMSRGAGLSDQLGLDRRFSIYASQGAVAFATAFGAVGGSGIPGWKMPDKDAVMALDQSLRLNAAKSDMASQLNATLRINDEIGVSRNTEFSALARAVKAGQTHYQHKGQTKSVFMHFEEWAKLASDAGVDMDVAYSIRSNPAANQEYGALYNTPNLLRLGQRDIDINPVLQQHGELAFMRYTRNQGESAGLAARAVELLWGRDATGQPIDGGLTDRDRIDPNRRYSELVRGLRRYADDTGINITDDQLRQASVRMWASAEQRFNDDPLLKGYGGLLPAFEVHNPKALLEARQVEARVQDKAKLASALSGIGRIGPLRRFMTLLEQTDGSFDFNKLMEIFAGGVKSDELKNALKGIEQNYRNYQLAGVDDTPEGRARRDEALWKLKDLSIKAFDAAVKEGFQVDPTPEVAAAKLLSAIGKADDRPTKELLLRLETPENRKQALGMATSYAKMQDMIKDKKLSPLIDADRDEIRQLIGEAEYKKIEPLIKAIESGKVEDAFSKPKDKLQRVKIDEPLKIEGSVRLEADRIIFRDVQSSNHRVPIE